MRTNKKIPRSYGFTVLFLIFHSVSILAQTPIPAAKQSKSVLITGGVIHVGNGKIIDIGPAASIVDARVIDLKGKQVYPAKRHIGK